MASKTQDRKSKTWRVQFVAGDGSRKTVRLGRANKTTAEQVRQHIEQLADCQRYGITSLPPKLQRWVADLDDTTHDRLVRVGLAAERQASSLADFLDAQITLRAPNWAPATIKKYQETRHLLVAFFGADHDIRRITTHDIVRWEQWLAAPKPSGKGRAIRSTVPKHLCRAKWFFGAAVKSQMIERQPVEGFKTTDDANPDKFHFVDEATAARVLAACPDDQWRLIFVLGRYLGLRMPSELHALRWSDIDWKKGVIHIDSPKSGLRVAPLFKQLVPYLQSVARDQHGEYVITHRRGKARSLRLDFARILRHAGIDPWPRIFHNLRATRQTELTRTVPAHVVAAWMGNSAQTAAKHYLHAIDDDFTAHSYRQPADSSGQKETREAAQKAAHSTKTAQKAAQTCCETGEHTGTLKAEYSGQNGTNSPSQPMSTKCLVLRGLGDGSNSPGKLADFGLGGAECGAVDGGGVDLDRIVVSLRRILTPAQLVRLVELLDQRELGDSSAA